MIRLQKYLADAGVASRRKAEEMISAGRVEVNGQMVNEMGIKVDPKKDEIYVDGKLVKLSENYVYIMLHKPVGYITTTKDQFQRATVMDLIKDVKERVFPVGRLDYDTSGLLLLTNDGDLTYTLTHPKHEVEKIYRAKLYGTPMEKDIFKFKRGFYLDGYKTAPAKLIVERREGRFSYVEIRIHEGHHRQVRNMCQAINHPVASLERVGIGTLELGDLEKGKYRHLSNKEISYLKKLK